MKKQVVLWGLVSAVLIGVCAEASAETIFACFNIKSGVMRHVTGSGLCKKSENEISWPAGPFLPNYFVSSDLNTFVNLGDTFTKIGDYITFTKERDDTVVEVILNSRAGSGTFGGGATGVVFEVRVDGARPTLGNQAAITTSNTKDFISIFAVFDGLPAGQHVVSFWGFAPFGTSSGASLDPGNFGGRIIAKETF